jgi:hypothetical protein
MVSPATCAQPCACGTARAAGPITTTSSTSQSVGTVTRSGSEGPTTQLANFANTIGSGGSAIPASPAWSA